MPPGNRLMERIARGLDNVSYLYMGTQKKKRRQTFYQDDLENYIDPDEDDPMAIFPNPGAVPDVHLLDVTRRSTYDIHKFRFRSFIETPHEENNIVHGRLYEQHGRPDAPTVIVLHGYRMESYLLFDRYCRFFVRRGFNAALMDLPYHMHRRPPNTYHGEFTFSDDAVLTLKVMKQSVSDVMATMNWLSSRGVPRIGIYGVSYGGMMAGLVGCVEPAVDFIIMVAPPADMGEVFFKSRLGRQFEAENPDARRVLARHREILDRVALINLTPLPPRDRIFIAEGLYDEMVPSALTEKLWRAWGRPHIRRYPHGHISVIILNPRLDRDLRAFLRKVEA